MLLFDFESALERFMGEREILIEVLPAYLENLEKNINELVSLDPDSSKIRELAHSIKGSSLNLDIVPLGKEAEQLEDLAYNKKIDQIPGSITKLKELAAKTVIEVKTYID